MKKTYLWIYTAVFLLSLVSVSGFNAFDPLLSPFVGIPEAYERYSEVIDFFIFFLVFLGLGQVVFAKKFEGRGGKVIAVGLAFVLSFALITTEEVIGFNIKSFGPLAAGMILLLVGFTLFHLIKTLGGSNINAGSFAIVIMYFSTRAVTPSFFAWMEDNPSMAVLNSILLVIVIISIVKIVWAVLPKHDNSLRGTVKEFQHQSNPLKEVFPEAEKIKAEAKEFKLLKKIVKKEIKDSKEIINDFKVLKELLAEYGNLREGRKAVAEEIQKIIPVENDFKKKIQYIRDLNKKLEDFDINDFKHLEQYYHNLTDKEKEEVKKNLLVERNKINAEQVISEFEKKVEQYDVIQNNYIRRMLGFLNGNQLDAAKNEIELAIKYEREIEEYMKKIRKIEGALKSLVKKELKILREVEV